MAWPPKHDPTGVIIRRYKTRLDGNTDVTLPRVVDLMARIHSVLALLLVFFLASEAIFSGESRKKGSNTIIRQKRQYLGYPYGMGYPYSYGFGYNPYMMYRPYPMYGMPYYRPYGFYGK